MKTKNALLLTLYVVCCYLDGMAQTRTRKFEIYDAMSYVGKPADLSSMGLLRMTIIYEASLTKPDPNVNRGLLLDMDKVRTHVESASYSGLHMINTDIERWYRNNIELDEMKERFTELFAQFREAIPGVQIGNYGIPCPALCVRHFYDEGKTDEQTMLAKWREDSRKHRAVAPLCDYLSPSVYIAGPDVELWLRDLKITVDEIRKFEPDKKLLVYIWPQYYDKPGSPYFKQFIAPAIWEQMLEGIYEYCDGAVIWSGTLDADGSKIQWTDPRVQELMDVTKAFLARHGDNVAKQQPLPPLEPLKYSRAKKFDLFHALAYAKTPDLSEHGIRRLKVVAESNLINGKDDDGIGIPDSIKIVACARAIAKTESPDMPILINQTTWINDRQKDNAAMMERFAKVQRIFKRHNTENPLTFFNITPSSIDQLRFHNPDYYANVHSWLHYSAKLTRGLAAYPDILLLTGYIIDNNVTEWERRFRVMVREARRANPNKPVYANLCTQYFSAGRDIIDGDTWFRMLEVVYALCDGVVIASHSQSEKQSLDWDDLKDLWESTEAFLKEYKISAID